jgi:rhomboid protease GluP
LRASSLLLLVNGFWFLLMLLADLRVGGGANGPLGVFGHFDGRLLVDFGSGASWLTLAGEWWRFVTPIFLHAGLLHFAFNSYVLLQLGPLVESEFGTERFWVAYLLCGIAGSAASQLLQPLVIGRPVNTVGASGAILGLMGILLVHGWRQGAAGRGLRDAMLRYLLYIVVFSLLVRGVDHFNHAGGLLCGAALGLVLAADRPRQRFVAALWHAASLGFVLLVVVAFLFVARALQPA